MFILFVFVFFSLQIRFAIRFHVGQWPVHNDNGRHQCAGVNIAECVW